FFQAEDGIRDYKVTGVQTCALPISAECRSPRVTAERKSPFYLPQRFWLRGNSSTWTRTNRTWRRDFSWIAPSKMQKGTLRLLGVWLTKYINTSRVRTALPWSSRLSKKCESCARARRTNSLTTNSRLSIRTRSRSLLRKCIGQFQIFGCFSKLIRKHRDTNFPTISNWNI